MRGATLLLSLVVALTSGSGTARGECCNSMYVYWVAEDCSPFQPQGIINEHIEKKLFGANKQFCKAKKCNGSLVDPETPCIPGDPVFDFQRLKGIPDASDEAGPEPTTGRFKRSNVFKNSRAVSKMARSAYDGYKEGKLSAEQSNRDAERARLNAQTTAKPTTPSYVQHAQNKYKPRWT